MADPTLTTLPDLRRVFYRLLGISELDDALAEHDSEVMETIDYFIQHGLWNAQSWMLAYTPYKGWRKETALTFTGTYGTGGKTAPLPSDFLRAAGSEARSAFRNSDGTRWGVQLTPESLGSRNDAYFIDDDKAWATRDTVPGSGHVFEYHYSHEVLMDDASATPLVFPLRERPLIPAEAAMLAIAEAWIPDPDPALKVGVTQNLSSLRSTAATRLRPTRQPTKFRSRRNRAGTQWF